MFGAGTFVGLAGGRVSMAVIPTGRSADWRVISLHTEFVGSVMLLTMTPI